MLDEIYGNVAIKCQNFKYWDKNSKLLIRDAVKSNYTKQRLPTYLKNLSNINIFCIDLFRQSIY